MIHKAFKQGELTPKSENTSFSRNLFSAELSYPPVDYLTFWNVQSQKYADYKLNQGQAAMLSGDLLAAHQNFHDGLEVLPEHEGIAKAMRLLEEKRSEPKPISAFKQKAAQALQDAVMEKLMKQGEAAGVAAAAAQIGNSSLYPLLPNESSSDHEHRKTRKKHKKKHRSHRHKYPKRNSEDGSSTTTTTSMPDPERKRRRRKRSKQHFKEGKSARLDDDCITVDSFEVERKRRKRIKKKRVREEPMETDDSSDAASTDSRRAPRRRVEPYRYKNKQDDDSITP
jgi:hypothetical protein